MTSVLKIAERIDGQYKYTSIYKDSDGSQNILGMLHNILSSGEMDDVHSIKFDYISKHNYFGVEMLYKSSDDEEIHVTMYTYDVVNNFLKIEQVINLINEI